MTSRPPKPPTEPDAGALQAWLDRVEETAGIGTWEWDVATDQVKWSRKLVAIFGAGDKDWEPSFQRAMDMMVPEDAEQVAAAVEQSMETGDPFSVTYRIVRPDGTMRWLHGTGEVELGEDGKPARLYGLARDITDVRAAERRFELLLESAPDAMLLVDQRGIITLANRQVTDLFGYDRDEVIGKNVDMLVPDALRGAHADHPREYADEPERRPMGAGLDLHALHKDGSEVPVEISLSPIDMAEGHMVLAAIRDVTDRLRGQEREQRQREHQVELDRLREMNDFKTQLLNTAAHELNTPLTPLRLQLHLLTSGSLGDLDVRQSRAIGVLERNVKRLADLVADVLDVAKLEAGSLKMEPVPVSMQGVSAEVMEAFEETARRVGVGLRVESKTDLVVAADLSRVTQVAFNLVSNALKFTPRGGDVRLRYEKEGDHIRVSVTDTGLGLTAEQMGRLFEPFSQVHEENQAAAGGTGLGLYICKGIIEQHGGTIGVQSEGPGTGSTFSFTLPIGHGDPVNAPTRQAPSVAPERKAAQEEDPIARRLRELI